MKKTEFTLLQAKEGYFLSLAARKISPHTISDYANTINKLMIFLGEDTPIQSITKHEIEEFFSEQDEISKKTLLNYHTGLSAMWHWAVDEKLVDKNIIRDIRPPKPETREIIPFTQAEIKLLLSSLERSKAYKRAGKTTSDHSIPNSDRNRAIILTLLDTGVRASELCDMKIKELDMRNRRIKVMGKGAKERIVQFSPRTGQAIWRYLASRPDARPNEPLFTTQEGRALDRNSLRHMLDNLGERALVKNTHPHRFRHTFACEFLRNKGNPYVLQALLGHSTLDMVRRYIHIVQADLEDAHNLASPVHNWAL